MILGADVADLLEELVAVDSTNRSIDPNGAGEAELGGFVADLLERLGFAVSVADVGPGRPNVVGIRAGPAGAPAILLEAHLDTVPAPPGGVERRRTSGRLWGRGACDCKGSLAAMLVAVDRLLDVGEPAVTIVLAGTADEEAGMTGAGALASMVGSTVPHFEAAVIGEPTSLVPVRAHPGVVRLTCSTRGHAAHAAIPALGRNAIVSAAALIDAVARLGGRLEHRRHVLTGPAVLSPTMISGGRAPNMVPDRCDVVVDRRVGPAENTRLALAELDDVVAGLVARGHDVVREAPFVDLPPVELAADHPLVALAETATGRPAGGIPFATDACQLAPAGVPCIVFGPGSLDQAHTDDEWVDLGEVRAAVEIYGALVAGAAALATTSTLGATA